MNKKMPVLWFDGNHTAEMLKASGCEYMVGSFGEIIDVAV